MKRLKHKLFQRTVAASALSFFMSHAAAFSLDETVWQRASDATCSLDPRLLYAIALVESQRAVDSAHARPNPLALNIDGIAHHPKARSEAADLLKRALAKKSMIDVGAMQISLRWNGGRVSDPVKLLDLETNVRVGAEILCEFVSQTDDIALAIGSYHTPNPRKKEIARQYGFDVLKIWRRLIVL